jgi:Ca2+-binding RTX toxin-like protein
MSTTRRRLPVVALAVAAVCAAALSTPGPASAATPVVSCPDLAKVIVGTAGADTLVGTEGPDIICGLGGDDTIRGLGGDDVIYGDDGRDTVHGNEGADTVYGGPDGDMLYGDRGADTLDGQDGPDEIAGGDDADVMYGGPGDDLGWSGPWLGGSLWDGFYGGDGYDEFVYENNSGGDAEYPHPPADWATAKHCCGTWY